MANWEVRVLDRSGALLASPAVYDQASFALLRNEVGAVELVMPLDLPGAQHLQPRNLLELWHEGVWVTGGIILSRTFSSREDGMSLITVSGPDYLGWLAHRLVKPPEGLVADRRPPAPGDNLLKAFVRSHVTDPTEPARDVPLLSCEPDESLSTKEIDRRGEGEGQYETVLEMVQSITTEADDVEFGVVREGGALIFRTWPNYRGANRAAGTPSPVILDLEGGGLESIEITEDGVAAENWLYVVGSNRDAPATLMVERSDSASVERWGRIEGLVSGAGATTTEAGRKGDEALKERAGRGVSVRAGYAPNGRYRFGHDFQFGDRVTVQWRARHPITGVILLDFTIDDEVSDVRIMLDGESIEPKVELTVGPKAGSGAPGEALGALLRNVQRQLSVLGRR